MSLLILLRSAPGHANPRPTSVRGFAGRVNKKYQRVKKLSPRYVKPEVCRQDGDFPVMPTKGLSLGSSIGDLDEAARSEGYQGEDTVPALQDRQLKPHYYRPKAVESRGKSPLVHAKEAKGTVAPRIPKLRKLPNPFEPLHRNPKGWGSDYYAKYFKDRERGLDGNKELVNKIISEHADKLGRPSENGEDSEDVERKKLKKKKAVRARDYWYEKNYRSSDPLAVPFMCTKELKRNMLNEAHKMNQNPDLAVDEALWEAYLRRAAQLSDKCHFRSLLRVFQAAASVQVYNRRVVPYYRTILAACALKFTEMKPENFCHLMQALSRLQYRDEKLIAMLQKTALTWPTVPHKILVKAANSAAKLDLATQLWCKPLAIALCQAVCENTLIVKEFMNIKWITAVEMFDDSTMINYLYRAEAVKREQLSDLRYSRHLQVVELYVRLCKEEAVWQQLNDNVKEFLRDLRKDDESAEEERERLKEEKRLAKEKRRKEVNKYRRRLKKYGEEARPLAAKKTKTERLPMSCPFHREVSELLSSAGLQLMNGLKAGPFNLDMFHGPTNTVIEVCPEWQFYANTTHLTSRSRVRHMLIRKMGFNLALVPFQTWESLSTADDRLSWLSRHLPRHLRLPELIQERDTRREAAC
ncbi:hypothetical protein FOZ62_004509 [Perkinsus olseni]|uniref:RAP domain-containing protein n=1 Tax=Perkinsus olseni TaxID=32597 RepID=A0A7J6Q8G5_PEROL|nr:hypothetical protein FOZ62_004509 [Perkinsus olseni]